MALYWYPAIIEKAKEGFGVWFPDIDGCVTAGETIEDAMAKAGEVLAFWFEDAKDVPVPTDYASAKKRGGASDVVMLVPARIPERLERVNVSLTDATLAMGDELAAAEGTTRSGLITQLIHDRYRTRLADAMIGLQKAVEEGRGGPLAKRHRRLVLKPKITDQKSGAPLVKRSRRLVLQIPRDPKTGELKPRRGGDAPRKKA